VTDRLAAFIAVATLRWVGFFEAVPDRLRFCRSRPVTHAITGSRLRGSGALMGRIQSCRHGPARPRRGHTTELSQSLDRRDDRRAGGRHKFATRSGCPSCRTGVAALIGGYAAARGQRARCRGCRRCRASKPHGTANFITESDYRWHSSYCRSSDKPDRLLFGTFFFCPEVPCYT